MFANLKNLLTKPVVVASAIAGMLIVGVQQLGVLESIELKAYDQMMQRRADLSPDPRLLIVGFTEADIQKLQQGTPNGIVLDKILSKLERHQPKVIGLDFFRDVPVQPGHQQLLAHLKQSSLIVPICRVGGGNTPAVPQPLGIKSDIVGFADIPEGKDGIIRRNLLVITPNLKSSCTTAASLGLQLAVEYLKVQPDFTKEENLQLGKKIFKRLKADSGGYQHMDVGGFQILLNYRGAKNIAQQVSFTDMLNDRFKSSWVKNRIVLIGSTAPSSQDIRNTPYSDGKADDSGKMPGVIIHAHMVSQILDAVSDKRPLFWFLPAWGKILWILGWTVVGGVLAWRIQHPLRLGVASCFTVILLFFIGYAIFLQAGWVPLVSPALGLLGAVIGVVSYTAFQEKQYKEKISLQIKEQDENILLLQALLREGGNYPTQTHTAISECSPDVRVFNNRYKTSDVLGCGGFSYTYLAEDTHRPGKHMCVVKHLQPARTDEGFLEIARRLFKTEAEILELLGHHNQIPQLMAYFEEDRQFYLVQEYIKGHPLNEELTPGQQFSEAKVIDFLKDVLSVLMFVHSHGVIHRDIKPSNLIRRQKDNSIVLIDFGAVKQIEPQQLHENPTVAVGTAGYAPPEQFMGLPRSNSDIYALGMVAIQALTGASPRHFERNETMALVWRGPTTSEPFAVILDKMVSYDFHHRYQSVEEVLQSLEKL
ncbi:MAG: CHASE2 domain-containing serine/threonine-protein kinase [Rhizonema sp. PD37]|nr:CHASE2 domain-containing serine/threonine-protein kinase [Rhizonema sp. PD37]